MRYVPKVLLTVLGLSMPLIAVDAYAAGCELTVEGNDAMQFNTKEIVVGADCKEFKITLKHAGKLPKAAMGHNLLITTAEDMQPVLAEATKAGVTKDYLPEGDKRVVFSTKLVGGGESVTGTLKRADLQAGKTYKFFCSFPGHFGLMQGSVKF